ncbi:DUF2783 domain-containing protein [uncultured Thiothrix sp.]|jgi:hypothetical protein|uniref:DUF2783 domain-containing protein n=1 Tax=uncultured Thiothrix sp. TaxID=223185 RepID=UPI00261B8AC0|nr:DUF2783 domain-containing protein [uncultured Thiothrix sp.]HMT92496.1 DUF2783 domain-containing protein [Thiolinea sp.]
MSQLNLQANFSDADAFFAALADLHREGDERKSERINARLILILANHIGDQAILLEAMRIAAQLTTTDE